MTVFNLYQGELRHLGINSEAQFESLPKREQDRLLDECADIIEENNE